MSDEDATSSFKTSCARDSQLFHCTILKGYVQEEEQRGEIIREQYQEFMRTKRNWHF